MNIDFNDLIGYSFARNEDWKNSNKPLSYITAKNGSFEYRKSQIGTFITETKAVPKLEEVKPGVFLDIPKIPFEILNYMTAWHRAVYLKDKTESTIMIFYNESEGYKLWVPIQENSTANSKYIRDEDPEYTQMCRDNILVMVAHSHPWKGSTPPSPSGTDNADEKESILYMIMNNVEEVPNVFVSTCPGGKRISLNFFDIFENPIENISEDENVNYLLGKYVPLKEIFATYSKPESVEIPSDWMQKHSTKKYVATSFASRKYETGKDYSSKYEKSNLRYGNYSNADDDYMHRYVDEYTRSYQLAMGRDILDYDELEDELEYEINTNPANSIALLGDAIDSALDLDKATLAQLIVYLIDEGNHGLVKACLEQGEIENDGLIKEASKNDIDMAKKALGVL